MSDSSFEKVMAQVPEQQRQLLEKMGELGLLTQFASHEPSGRWGVVFTRQGLDFLEMVRAVTQTDAGTREARLIALDLIADGKGVFSGFAEGGNDT